MIPLTDKISSTLAKLKDIEALDPEDRFFLRVHGLTDLLNNLLHSVFLSNVPFRVEGQHDNRLINSMKLRNSDDDDWRKKRVIDGTSRFVDSFQSLRIKDGGSFDFEKFYKGEQVFFLDKSWDNICYNCGEKFSTEIFWDVESGELVIKTEDSECFDITVDHSFDLYFKAGDEILFGDWVGGPHDSGSYLDLNSEKGLYENSLFYSKHNIGYVQVGNSCPSVYRDGDLIYIGIPKGKKSSDLEKLGFICTDLWATSFSTARDIDASCEGLDPSCCTSSANGRGDVFLTLEKDTKFEVSIHPRTEAGIEVDEDGEEYQVRHYATIRMV